MRQRRKERRDRVQQIVTPRGGPQGDAHENDCDDRKHHERPSARAGTECGSDGVGSDQALAARKAREEGRGDEGTPCVDQLGLSVGDADSHDSTGIRMGRDDHCGIK